MKTKKLISIIFIFLFITTNTISDEIRIDSPNIEIEDKGNIIIAYDSDIYIPSKEIKIKSKKAKYNKLEKIITFNDNVYLYDLKNNIIIQSDLIIYYDKKNLIYSDGETDFKIEKSYEGKSKDIYYNANEKYIYSEEKTIIKDNKNNTYNLEDKFEFDISKEIIKAKKSIILDNENNSYIFQNLAINLKTDEIVGKEIKVDYDNSYFGNSNNRPVLKGKSGYSNDDKLTIYKAVFSTCNTENKKCRGWELNTEEFNHDKIKKIFEYKNSWLKIFNYKVFYSPYFSHPDPSVKRKSGFLTPSYSSSNTLGTSINTPYFKVLSFDKDITINPKFYADKSFMVQNEYRQALEKSDILSDFSFLLGEHGTKSHFFYNQIGKLNNKVNFELNLQDVKGDNYIKTHKLKQSTPLIDRDDYLLSNFDTNWKFKDSSLSTSFKIYENLSGLSHDRYTYVLPHFNFIKEIDRPENYNGSFNFNSSGSVKNYQTNINDTNITNDFLFSSNEIISLSGFSSNYDILLKNHNYYSKNPNNEDDSSLNDLFGILKIDSSFPMQKKMKNFTNFLKPVASLRYSPNGNSDLSNNQTLLDYNSVFSLNRLGSTSEVEGGGSLSLGLEFSRENNDGFSILDFKVANVLRLEDDYRLPKKTNLNKTRSDIFGNLTYNFNELSKIDYYFSYDRDLQYSNLDQLSLQFGLNNFISKFEYYTEKNDIEDKENIKNKSSYTINNENSLNFNVKKDLENDYTQYYDLIYIYQTDCISVNLNYSKSFYRDGSFEPNQSLSFLIKIIPFNEFGVPNIGNLIGY